MEEEQDIKKELYNVAMTIEEMRNLQLEYYRKNGRKPLTLEQINQYIDEVRKQKIKDI